MIKKYRVENILNTITETNDNPHTNTMAATNSRQLKYSDKISDS